MTAGTINDGNGGTTMNGILAENGYDYTFTQANEGHSWGNWRGQLAELLGAGRSARRNRSAISMAMGTVDAADYTVWRNTLGQAVARGTGPTGITTAWSTTADYQVWKANYGTVYDARTGGGGEWIGRACRSRRPAVCSRPAWPRRWPVAAAGRDEREIILPSRARKDDS